MPYGRKLLEAKVFLEESLAADIDKLMLDLLASRFQLFSVLGTERGTLPS